MKKNYSKLVNLYKVLKMQGYISFLSPEDFDSLISSLRLILQCLSGKAKKIAILSSSSGKLRNHQRNGR